MRGELETEQNCNILTPTLMPITAFLSRFPALLNRRPGGSASLGHGPHSSIFSPTDSIGGPEAPLCWVLVFSTASYLQLTRTSCAPSYIIVLRPLNSTCRQSRLSPWYLQPDAPVIYTGEFPILTARPGSICISTYVLYMCMFPACYFRQGRYVAQGLINEIQTRMSSSLIEYIYNTYVRTKKKFNSNLFVDLPIYIYICVCVCVCVCKENIKTKYPKCDEFINDDKDNIKTFQFY